MSLKMNIKSVFCTLLILMIPSLAAAQEEPITFYDHTDTLVVEADRVIQLPTYSTIASKLPIELRNTPASIGVVPQSLFINQASFILSDALSNVSGVNIQSNFGVHDFFLIRGFSSVDNGMVMTDGAIEPEAMYYHLYNIERVEVLKGPAAFLYGGNPISGVVNLTRKQPIFTNFLKANGSFGHFNTMRGSVDLGLGDLESGFAFRLNGLAMDSENYRDGTDNRRLAINPSLTWLINDNTSLTANIEVVDNDYAPDSGVPLMRISLEGPPIVPDIPRTRSYQLPVDRSDQNALRSRVDFYSELNETVTVRNKFYYTDLDWNSAGTLLLGVAPDIEGNPTVFRTVQSLDDRQKFLGNQLEFLLKANTGSVKHNIVAGFEAQQYKDDFDLQIAQVNPVPLFTDFQESVTSLDQLQFAPFAAGKAKSTVIAPYFVDQITLAKQAQLFIGGRYDVIDYENNRSDFDFMTFMPVASVDTRDYKKFSPMAGLNIAPSEDFSLYFSAGQAFAPPSTLTQGDPEPEETTQIEAGAKMRFSDGKVHATFAVYNLEKKNIGIPDQTGVLQQTGDQRSRGLEFELRALPAEKLFTSFSYAYTDAELTNFTEFIQISQTAFQLVDYSDNKSPFAPDHIFNFWATKELRNGIGFGGGARYVSGQFIDEDNAFEIDPTLTLNGILFFNQGNWRWTLNAKNITNRKTFVRGFSNSSVIPADPFTIYGGVEFSL